MIKIDNLNLNFDSKKIFNNGSIRIDDGKITVIAGANGVGKTTLLKIVVSLAIMQINMKQLIYVECVTL